MLKERIKLPIQVCEPLLEGNELKYLSDCIHINWISSKGIYVQKFEKAFAEYCGCKYGIATTSGTSALHVALLALGIGKGDEVIVPAFTFIASIFAVIYTGAKPVLVDAESTTANMDVTKIEEKINRRTKAIMPVHIYGQPCQMDEIIKLSLRYNLHVVEDAAEAHGAMYLGNKVGSMSDAGCFSFYSNKIISSGEGGMVVTNSPKIADRVKSLKDYAYTKDRRYVHTELAYNYRMTNLQAAIGLAQTERVEELVKMRQNHAAMYTQLLSGTRGIQFLTEIPHVRHVHWMNAILVNEEFGMASEGLADKLKVSGIETRPFFVPMNKQPACLDMGLFRNESYPVAEELSRKGLLLPSSSGLKEEEIWYICETIKKLERQRS